MGIATNQNPKDEWRRFAPPLIFWVLCPKQGFHCYNLWVLIIDIVQALQQT
jgi:hypothetical protein